MKFQTSNVFILIFVAIKDICQGSIICSTCHLKEYPDCQEKPPKAQPCFDPGDGIPQTCSVIRTYDRAGDMVDFRRSCSNSLKSGCIDEPLKEHRICASICTTDYCNMSSAAPPPLSAFWWPRGLNASRGFCGLGAWVLTSATAAAFAAAGGVLKRLMNEGGVA